MTRKQLGSHMENEDNQNQHRAAVEEKMKSYCVKVRALPGGGPLDRWKEFLIAYVDAIYEGIVGRAYVHEEARQGALPPSHATLLQTQPVIMGSAPMVVQPQTGNNVQMFDPGKEPGGAHVQLFDPGQQPGSGVPVPGGQLFNTPAGRDSMGGTVELLPPGTTPPTAAPITTGAPPTVQLVPPPSDTEKK
jgi:hypothetical protein